MMNSQQEVAERLIDAVAEENLVALRDLLSQKQQQGGGANDVDVAVVTDDDVDKALMAASENGNVEAIDLLFNSLSESAKEKYRNEENPSDYFPLHMAVLEHHRDAVQFLVLDCHCNTNQLDDSGLPPLHLASKFVETSRFLLENGADPNKCIYNIWEYHPLYTALNFGQVHLVRLLLEYGADPNFQRRPEANRHGCFKDPPVADRALFKANPEILSLLLQHGAILGVSPNFVGLGRKRYENGFIKMLAKGHLSLQKKLSVCRTLVEHAKSNSSNSMEYIQAHIDKVIRKFNTCFGDVLLQSGVVPHRTTMLKAVQEGKVSTCRLLVQNGVNPFRQENTARGGASLFRTAATGKETEVFEFFLDLWVDERFSSTVGGDKPSMHVVCGYSNVSLQAVQLLIERQGRTLMAVDPEHGLRPFLVASMRDAKLDVIYTLLRHDPDALGRH